MCFTSRQVSVKLLHSKINTNAWIYIRFYLKWNLIFCTGVNFKCGKYCTKTIIRTLYFYGSFSYIISNKIFVTCTIGWKHIKSIYIWFKVTCMPYDVITRVKFLWGFNITNNIKLLSWTCCSNTDITIYC